jgi:hypothetical protein
MAKEAGVSVVTLRRRLRPVRDIETRRLWATRLDLKQRPRGDSLAVFHACRKRFADWRNEISGGDLPVPD